MSRIGKQIIDGLKDFERRLKRGEEFTVTRVRREMTPDGPLHTFEKIKRKLP